MSSDSKFDHIDLAEKQKVLNECVEAEAWLREKKQHQDTLPKHAMPALLCANVKKKAEALDNNLIYSKFRKSLFSRGHRLPIIGNYATATEEVVLKRYWLAHYWKLCDRCHVYEHVCYNQRMFQIILGSSTVNLQTLGWMLSSMKVH